MAYQDELAFAITITKQIGKVIRDNLTIGHAFEIKKDHSTLTEIDKRVNHEFIEAIKQRYPKDGVLGEEESALSTTDERIWVLDPIDGTRMFKSGVPTCCIMLAMLVKGKPVLGVIYNPVAQQLFTATHGQGAFVEDRHGKRQVHVDAALTKLEGTIIGATGSITGTIFSVPGTRKSLEDAGVRPQILGSTGYELAMVAAGQFGGQLFAYEFRHDIAAAAVIIPEAGGMVTDAHGKPLDFTKPIKGAISSNGILHEQLVALVKPHIAAA